MDSPSKDTVGDGRATSNDSMPTVATTGSTSNIPFPPSGSQQNSGGQAEGEQEGQGEGSANQSLNTENSSNITMSDKLSALPVPRTPNLNRSLRSPPRNSSRRMNSFDASSSVPSLPSRENDHRFSPLLGSAVYPRASASEGSFGNDTPKRVSFESERGSLPNTLQGARNAFSRSPRMSDSSPEKHNNNSRKVGSASPSPSHSRATSPFRALQQWSAGLRSRASIRPEDPFVPIDPFKLKFHFPHGLPCFDSDTTSIKTEAHSAVRRAADFFSSTLPRVVYLHFLLRLPAMYFTRVARIFEDAEVSKPDIDRMIEAHGGYYDLNTVFPSPPQGGVAPPFSLPPNDLMPYPEDWTPALVSPALVRFKRSWEAFIDSLLKEWKTLNLVSALLLSGILTMFQVQNAETDPITRNAALLSLVCALMSLASGCIYIVRFGTMRSMYRASRWAEEARRTKTSVWWNVWVFLAMPAVFLSWSMIFFIACIMSYVWRTGSVNDSEEKEGLSPRLILIPRIIITVVFAIGLIYFALIVRTLRSYGRDSSGRRRKRGDRDLDVERGRVRQRGERRRREQAARERQKQDIPGAGAEPASGAGAASAWNSGVLGLGIVPPRDSAQENGASTALAVETTNEKQKEQA